VRIAPIARVLVVDDERDLVTALCRTLEAQGYSTTGAASGAQALDALRAAAIVDTTRFDVLITDLTMPAMDGITLLRAVQHIDANLVVIIMTGHGTVDTAVDAMKNGALDYILKPFNLRVALPVLSRAVAMRQLRLENDALLKQVTNRTAQLKERESLLQEIHHRVKNNLQVISSLINMQIRGLKDESSRRALRDCQSRVITMAKIHEMLYQAEDYARVPFAKYAKELTTNILQAAGTSLGNVALQFELDEISLPVEQAIPCGLILNELIANSLKHAFPNGAHGSIRVVLQRAPDSAILLAVSDTGIGISPTFELETSSSLGLQLVMTLVEQIEGRLDIIREPSASFRITFPQSAA